MAPACSAEGPQLDTDEAKTLYTLGIAISRNLYPIELSEGELAIVQAGLADGAQGREPRVSVEEFGPKIDALIRERIAAATEREKEAGVAFRAEAAEEKGAVTTESGLIYKELEPGDGASPTKDDTVKLHYHGTLRDGSVFDSSLEKENAEPATFSLARVIGCFAEGVQKMKIGGKSKLTCPPEIAYGDRGSPPTIRPGATLVFEVELLDIVAPDQPAPSETSEKSE
jgi:FKBP-type peptidyl-prolyl cis-trans isomerase FkpA/FKBP-type peptidyl-prolyl cis-trans isomerase FklB